MVFVGRRNGQAMRRRIEKVARAHPGISKNALAEKIGVHWNAVQYHVELLVQEGRIHVEDHGWSHALFAPEVPASLRRLVSAIRHPDRSLLLDAVMAYPQIGSYQLSQELNWTRKKVLAHLSHLQEDGLVERIGHVRPRYRSMDMPEDLDALALSLGHDAAEDHDGLI